MVLPPHENDCLLEKVLAVGVPSARQRVRRVLDTLSERVVVVGLLVAKLVGRDIVLEFGKVGRGLEGFGHGERRFWDCAGEVLAYSTFSRTGTGGEEVGRAEKNEETEPSARVLSTYRSRGETYLCRGFFCQPCSMKYFSASVVRPEKTCILDA